MRKRTGKNKKGMKTTGPKSNKRYYPEGPGQ